MRFSKNDIKTPLSHIASRSIFDRLDLLCDYPGSYDMKELQLSQGQVALVDDQDYDFLNQWKWSAVKMGHTFYAVRNKWIGMIDGKEKGQIIQMHRLIMGFPEGMSIDHINHIGTDNRRENLRICTHRENLVNMRTVNKCGFRGVSKNKNWYISQITIKNKKIYLGTYKTPEEAHDIYMEIFNRIN